MTKTQIRRGDILFANVPFTEYNPHMHTGKHLYIAVSNIKACTYSPVLQFVPISSNCQRRLPSQVEVKSTCLNKRSFALAEQLTLLPKSLFKEGSYCGHLEDDSMEALERAIKIQLAL